MNIALFGAALDTGNLGVSALAVSILEGIFRINPEAKVILFDYKNGNNRTDHLYVEGEEYSFERMGMYLSKKIWKQESLFHIRFLSKLPFVKNKVLDSIKNLDIALDITGGDSFTDLYGNRVFKSSILRKKIIIQNSIDLVLLPQTYGPFNKKRNFKKARKIINKAKYTWARDSRSFEKVKEITGKNFDITKHRLGVDVAFLLTPQEPENGLPQEIQKWQNNGHCVVGLNINGLIYNNSHSKRIFNHKADYKHIVKELITKLIIEGNCKIVLVSHVIAPLKNIESDNKANLDIFENLPDRLTKNIYVLPEIYDQSKIKWIISKLDWFCGTRMHSTIAALSTGIPTSTIAYSIKARGVFASCKQEQHVSDLQNDSNEEILDIMWNSFIKREAAKRELVESLKDVISTAENQMDIIFSQSQKL